MEFTLHNNQLLKRVDTDLFKGWAPATEYKVLTDKPRFTWKGAKIPFALWTEVVCFLRWTQEMFKEEAMMTFFYHTEEKKWSAWPFPQEPNGMSIKLLPEHPLYIPDRAQFGKGWIQAGSIHHHCAAAAFQSGTDNKDEQDRDGVHITLGKMDENILDVHVRQVFEGVMGDTYILDWVETPGFLEQAPLYLKYDFCSIAVKCVRKQDFPEVWKSRIIERMKFPNGYHHTAGHENPHTGTPTGLNQSPMQTLLTKGNSEATNPGTETRQKNERGTKTGNDGGIASPVTDWEEGARVRLRPILLRLGITAPEAHDLLKNTPNAMWTADERLLRQCLMSDIMKTGTPVLYAEGVIERMRGESLVP